MDTGLRFPTPRAAAAGIALIGAFASTGPAGAADRALLIGMTDYADARFDLDGIDLDLDTMHRFARRVGFAEEDILTLSGAEVTEPGLRDAFAGFLGRGTAPGDRVLVYYSGHGLQVTDRDGDEADGRDEALTLHSLGLAPDGYVGTLVDDRIDELFALLPDRDVFFVVDACHSGTVSRGLVERRTLATRAYGSSEFAVKALPWRGGAAPAPGAGAVSKGGGAGAALDDVRAGLVTLSAAQDDEQALASPAGSTFTLALSEALETGSSGATPRALVALAGRLIDERIDADQRFVPNLTGDPDLFDRDLAARRARPAPAASGGAAPAIASTASASDGAAPEPATEGTAAAGAPDAAGAPAVPGVNARDLLALAEGTEPLAARLDRERYPADAPVTLSVEVPAAGWINVLGVDADDAMVVLWPNAFDRDNRVAPGTLELPAARDFEWVAQPPWGGNLMLVLFSRSPLDLFASSLQKDVRGRSTAAFALPSAGGLRRTRSLNASAELAAATLGFETCERAAGRCGP